MPLRAAVLVMIGACVFTSGSAHAATFNVTTTADSGAGSLRQAVIDANASEDTEDEIRFSSALSGQTIVLLSPLEDIEDEKLTFDATATSSGVTIDGGGTEFLANASSSDALQFENVSYESGSIRLRSGTTFTLQESASDGVVDDMLGDDITLIKTGTGTTSVPLDSTVDLQTGTSNSSEVRIENGELVVNGTLHTATLLVLSEGTFTVEGTDAEVSELKTFESQGTTLVDGGTLSATSVLITGGSFTIGDTGEVTATTFQSGGTSVVDGTLNAGTTTTGVTPMTRLIVDPQSAFTIGETGHVTTKAVESQGTFVVNGILDGQTSVLIKPQSTFTVGDLGEVDATTVTVQSGGALTVDGALDATTLDADGPVTVNSGGTLTATTSVDARSAFTVNGTVATPSLSIGPLATLTGAAGSIEGIAGGPTTVEIDGRVAPATATGHLDVDGDLSFGSSSVLDVDVEPGGGDSLDATGALTIAPGARLVFRTNPSEHDLGDPPIPLITADSVEGSFTPGTNYAFLTESVTSTGTQVLLTLAPNDLTFSSFAFTPNQRRVAQYLEAAEAGAAPGSDLAAALDELNQSRARELTPLLDAIGGESLTAFATARQILAERTARALHRRVRDPAWGSGRAFYQAAPTEMPDVAAQGDDATEPEAAPPSLVSAGAWFDALGVFGELDGEPGEAEVDTLLYGGTLGADAAIADHFVLGLAAGYARSDVDLDHRDADVFGDTVQGALYAGFVDPRGYLSAYGRYAYTFEVSRREIESSAMSRRARARFDAEDYGVGGELGLTVLSIGGVSLQPIAGVDWLRMSEERYTERGAGDLNLVVDPDTLESTTARFGGRLFGRFVMGEVGTFVPELRAFYQHLSGDRERVLDARLVGTPGLGSIGVRGAELPRENLLVGVGWGVLLGENLTLSLDYDALLGSDRVEHQGTIAARVAF